MTATITKPAITSPLFKTDAYKLDHRRQYPEGTTAVYANFTPRGSRIEGVDKVVHFGLQAFLQSFCIEAFAPFFAAKEDLAVKEFEATVESILGVNQVGSEHIRALHKKGYLPLRFSAVPEGTALPLRMPAFTVENTEPGFFWLTNYIETAVSAEVWQPSTSATVAHQFRQHLDAAAIATTGDTAGVDWQLHDFSFRGMAGIAAAEASGAAHLLSFLGSDSLGSIDWINRYYPGENGQILGSVPATEHSVMCAGGKDGEAATYERLLDLYPTGIASIVSDTWDLWAVLTEILPSLKEEIMERDGKLVIRPDSGDPVKILTGSLKHWQLESRQRTGTAGRLTPAEKGVVEILWEIFGGTVNEQGFRVLDSHIGAIYGDSITLERAQEITDRLAQKGFASTNVVLGVGSYTYQYKTRDSLGYAMKATWIDGADGPRNIQKDPATDNGLKKSATGRLAVIDEGDGPVLIQEATPEEEAASLLQPVWEDGQFLVTQSFADVRSVLGGQA